MSEQYIGEIRMFGGNYAPQGWALCDGRLLAVSDNDSLFSLIGTTYGGDGQTTFALPDLRGRLPVNQGTGADGGAYQAGAIGGEEAVALTPGNIPAHTHALAADSGGANQEKATGHVLARSNTVDAYIGRSPAVEMSHEAIAPAGGSDQPHDNMQPYQCVTFIIALVGVYPTQN